MNRPSLHPGPAIVQTSGVKKGTPCSRPNTRRTGLACCVPVGVLPAAALLLCQHSAVLGVSLRAWLFVGCLPCLLCCSADHAVDAVLHCCAVGGWVVQQVLWCAHQAVVQWCACRQGRGFRVKLCCVSQPLQGFACYTAVSSPDPLPAQSKACCMPLPAWVPPL